MTQVGFNKKVKAIFDEHEKLVMRKNIKLPSLNGIFHRYQFPVITAEHSPVFWRYDLNYKSNPHLLERMSINSTFNCGAMKFQNRYILVVRVEGVDRKSFFAIAESPTGLDQFRFWDYPITMPETADPDVNVYDMRLTQHEDGWIYGVFCTERKDPQAPATDTSAAVAMAGIARTKDLVHWQRLPDLRTRSSQQRNVVLHPEFVDGKYVFFTRPQDSFIDTGSGGGICWGQVDDIAKPIIAEERLIDPKRYHTINEMKNGQGPAPLKTEAGWLNLAHGTRQTAAGLRYVLYLFMTDLNDPARVIYQPGGYFIAPQGEERLGDVSNVVFSNGWIADDDGSVFIYYGSSDTRIHVATSTIEKLIDYVKNTPPDPLRSAECVRQRNQLISKNLKIMRSLRLK